MTATQGGTDVLTVRVGSTVLLLNLFGGPDFIPDLSYGTDGATALDMLDVSQFIGGNLTLFSLPSNVGNITNSDNGIIFIDPELLLQLPNTGNNGTITSTILVAPKPQSATFFINDVSRVPEPATLFAVAAGGLVIWLKRRHSR
jgi:hypothetical protein